MCGAICVPDTERINYPKAFVVMKDDVSRNSAEEEIMEICEQNLPEYMIPDIIEFVDDLPRTPRGKVDYLKLEEMANTE